MSRILDPKFRYRPSFDTDIRKTFEKARRQQKGVSESTPKPEGKSPSAPISLAERKKRSG